MTTYYIDKNNLNVGDGSESNPWRSPTSANTVPTGSTVFFSGVGKYRLTTPIRLYNSNVTWDLNGSELTGSIDVNSMEYTWHKSIADDQYYCTLSNGTNPNIITVKSCDINGDIRDESQCIGGLIEEEGSNWRFGDYDTLGYSTLYVRLQINGVFVNPSSTPSAYIDAAQLNYVFWGNTSKTGLLLKNGTISGANVRLGYMYGGMSLYNLLLKNSNDEGIIFTGTDTNTKNVSFCRFLCCGHRGFISDQPNITININHCHFAKCHIIGILESACAGTILNFKNNSSDKLVAGVFSIDAVTAIINEDYNQFYVDPDSLHTSKMFHYGIVSEQWLTTGVHSLPSAVSTIIDLDAHPESSGINAITTMPVGKLLKESPCVNTGTFVTGVNMEGQIDPWGKKIYGTPNIGADQGAGTPHTGFRQITILGKSDCFFG